MLNEIVAHKQRELAERKAREPLDVLRRRLSDGPRASFRESLQQPRINVIAEIKYRSPSRGEFPCQQEPLEIAETYAENGAAAVSVLTDERFFAGSGRFLEQIHEKLPELPLLRKDFILDPYQVTEAALWGASAFLLIAACLDDGQLVALQAAGADHGLDALVEVHDARELERAVESGARIIGVNNRDLRTFEVDLETSFQVARRLEGESGYLLVSESGIRERVQIEELRDAGFAAFLIGSYFMESDDPGSRLAELLGEAK